MGYADASNDRRIAENGWYVSEVIKESNTRAKKDGRDIDMYVIE